jgi:hypothetical protein
VPKIKATGGASRGRDDDEDDEDGGGNQRREDFIRRMEATERVRTEQLRRTRAERDYLAQIDKKVSWSFVCLWIFYSQNLCGSGS